MRLLDVEVLVESSRRQRTSLGNVEKDYVLSVALVKLAEVPVSRYFVFKGGTCLKKAYFPDYRFSADLDFTCVQNNAAQVKENIIKIFRNNEIEGVQFLDVLDRTGKGKKSLNLVIQYISKIAGEKRHIDSVRVDFNFKNAVFLKPETGSLIFPEEYALPPTELKVMSLSEILSEKAHAVYKRPKPRDLYDLWILLKKDVRFDVQLVNRKLKPLNKTFAQESFQERLKLLETKWKRDMSGLITDYPNFESTKNETLKIIGRQLEK